MFTLYQIDFVATRKAMRKSRNIYPICDSPLKGDVPQDDSQRRFLAQHRVATLLRHCFEWLQHCSNIAALCCAKDRPCESFRLTSPLSNDDGDVNENGKAAITLHVHHAFLYISLPSLHDYDEKMPNFTFCKRRGHKTTTFFFFP